MKKPFLICPHVVFFPSPLTSQRRALFPLSERFTTAFAVSAALFTLATLSSRGFAQGIIHFVNSAPIGTDTFEVTLPDGRGVGPGFTAQLYGGREDLSVSELTPLLPTTTFGTGSRAGFVIPVLVPVPGVPPLSRAKVLMRVFDGASWETSLCRGESDVTVLRVGGGEVAPTSLTGLRPFSVTCIPEPSTMALLCCGLGSFLAFVRGRHH